MNRAWWWAGCSISSRIATASVPKVTREVPSGATSSSSRPRTTPDASPGVIVLEGDIADPVDVVDPLEEPQFLQLALRNGDPGLCAGRLAQVLDEEMAVGSGHQAARPEDEEQPRRCCFPQKTDEPRREIHMPVRLLWQRH